MRISNNIVAGIDISQDRISIVWLKAGTNGPEVVKSAVVPMPEGAVKDGNIADAALLSKTIRELKRRSRVRTSIAAVSLFARPVVVQIIDMPKQMPSNISQFVHNEVKNCVTLPSRDIVLDFCGINSSKRTAGSANSPQAEKRVLAVAAESTKMVELVRVCSRAGFNAEIIEPPLLAYLRAIHSQKIIGKSGCNVLVAMLRGTALTLCVLKNGTVDFIRTKEIVQKKDSHADLNSWLADEISEVIRFYDIEVSDNQAKWEITVFADTSEPSQITESSLKAAIRAQRIQVRTIADAYTDTPVNGTTSQDGVKPSPVAVGLAMRILTTQADSAKINLIPHRIVRIREAKRDVIIAANAVGALLLIMILSINGFALMIEKTTRNAAAKEQLVQRQDTDVMLEQQQMLDAKIKVLSTRFDRIAQVSASHRDVNWVEVFEDIRKATPGSVRITGLSCQDGSRVVIEGMATSNEAVNLFVSLLEKSRAIASVVLLEARKQDGQSGLIIYQINCKLSSGSGKTDDVH